MKKMFEVFSHLLAFLLAVGSTIRLIQSENGFSLTGVFERFSQFYETLLGTIIDAVWLPVSLLFKIPQPDAYWFDSIIILNLTWAMILRAQPPLSDAEGNTRSALSGKQHLFWAAMLNLLIFIVLLFFSFVGPGLSSQEEKFVYVSPDFGGVFSPFFELLYLLLLLFGFVLFLGFLAVVFLAIFYVAFHMTGFVLTLIRTRRLPNRSVGANAWGVAFAVVLFYFLNGFLGGQV